MSLPHFPSYRWNKKGWNWYDYEEIKKWKLEHERRLREFFEWFESTPQFIHILAEIHLEYEEKKKGLLEPNK